MATVYMLIGVPAAGKSTWIAKQPFDWGKTVIVSTDNYIERVAKQQVSTYNAMFADHINDATKEMGATLRHAVKHGLDIVWDQTNTTAKSRTKKLSQLPDSYKKVAVVFPTPESAVHTQRLQSRQGKTIPDNVMRGMINGFEMPTSAEGFDEIKVL